MTAKPQDQPAPAIGERPSIDPLWGIGNTPSYVSSRDPRFSYWLYVPQCYRTAAPAHGLMLMAVHGSDRNGPLLRSLFADFAERHGVIVVAPHFPAGIGDPADVHGYKYIRAFGVRYDEALLDIVSDVAVRYGTDAERVMLFGFSGGAHFAHRFWYLHPERLRAVAIAAPGSVTLPDRTRDWWPGLRDVQQRFGREVSFEALRAVPALLVVGANDTSLHLVRHREDSPYWAKGADDAGHTRVERLRALRDALALNGIPTTYRELLGAGHEYAPLVEAAAEFFASAVPALTMPS